MRRKTFVGPNMWNRRPEVCNHLCRHVPSPLIAMLRRVRRQALTASHCEHLERRYLVISVAIQTAREPRPQDFGDRLRRTASAVKALRVGLPRGFRSLPNPRRDGGNMWLPCSLRQRPTLDGQVRAILQPLWQCSAGPKSFGDPEKLIHTPVNRNMHVRK